MTGAVVARVLGCYGRAIAGWQLEPLGNRGGFSGAHLWRLRTPAGPLCLRAAAPTETCEHLRGRHRLMRLACQEGLSFVPRVLPAADGSTVVEAEGRMWELMEWMPGQADYRDHPSTIRLQAAAMALGQLHHVWQSVDRSAGVCPAVLRRLEAVRCWSWADCEISASLRPLLEPLRSAVARWLGDVPGMLQGCATVGPLQPCLRDVWHDHLLYEGERLTGIVDYAAVGPDSVAADLARMLGSLIGDDEEGWQVALEAYRTVRPLSLAEERLARLLDRTGVIVALANWLRWLTVPGRPLDEMGLALRRVEELMRRVEAW